MSTLFWKPVVKSSERIPDELKRIITPRLWDNFTENTPGVPIRIDKDWIPYLTGLADAKFKGAQDLIDAIKEFKEIEISVEFRPRRL